MLGERPEGLDPSVFVHQLAFVESKDIGQETRVWAFAHIMKGAKVGSGCNIGENAFVESGAIVGNGVTVKNQISIWDKVIVEDDAFLGPNVVFTNDMNPRSFAKKSPEEFLNTYIKKGSTLGAGCVIVCGNSVGEYSFVAAGAVVTKDVPPYSLVQGNPARVTGRVCKCLKTIVKGDNPKKTCPTCQMEV